MAFQALQDEASARAKAAVQKLPHGDALFQQCAGGNISIENVLETLRHKAASTRRKKSSRLLDAFQRTTAWMLNIAPSIDVAVNASAGIACPVWAPIKFVLMSVRENATAIEHILEVVQHIADNLPRLDLYNQFQNELQFQAALVNLFADITEFSIRAYQFFKRKTMIRVGMLIGRNFKDEFDGIISSIHRRTKVVDDTASALHQQRMQLHIEVTQTRLQQESRVRTIQWLQPSNTREYHEQRLSIIVDKTCHWIFSHPTFCQWMGEFPKPGNGEPLIIHGRPGSGKSVLASFIYSMLESTTPDTEIAALFQTPDFVAVRPLLFSFSSSDTERQTLTSMSRTLLSQILENDKDNVTLDIIAELQGKSSVSISDLFDTLAEALNLLPYSVLAIIDGVDECAEATTLLFKNLNTLAQKATRLKVLLLGQSQAFTRFLASNANARSIAVGPESNHADISAVVDAEMEAFKSQWVVSVCDAVATSLKAKADGMFLWVRLMIDYLSGASCESELYECLDNLPEGLDQTYTLLLNRICTRISKHQQRVLYRVLSLVTASGRPLQLRELRLAYALMIEPEDNLDSKQTESYILRLQPQDLLEMCGGLVTYSDERFHIVHNSAREYLTCTTLDDRSAAATLKINVTESHEAMTRVCMKVFRDIDESDCSASFLDSRTALRLYASLYTAYHLNNSGRTREKLQKAVAELFESTQFFRSTEEMTPQQAGDASLQFIQEVLKLWRTLYPDAPEPEHNENEPDEIDHGPNTTVITMPRRGQKEYQRNRVGGTLAVGVEGTSLSLVSDAERNDFRHNSRLRVHDHSRTLAMTLPPPSKAVNAMRTARYFNLSMKLFKPLFVGKVLSDPMRILFDSVRRAAPSMPPSLMAAMAWYYYRMGKLEEAYEIGVLCAEKMRPNDTLLRMLLELLVGHAAYYLDKYPESIPYLEYAYKNAKRIPPFTHDATEFVLNLVDAYRCAHQQEKSLKVLRTFLQNHPSQELDEENQLRIDYNCGICEWYLDNPEAAIGHFVKFHRDCEKQEGNPLADYPSWPSKHYIETHYTLLQCLFEAYRDQEALAAFQMLKSLHERENSLLRVRRIIHKGLDAYKMALDYGATESEDPTRCSVADRCQRGQCFQDLGERMNVYHTILREDDRSERAFSDAMKYLEVYGAVHRCDRNPCKPEAGHAWHIAKRYSTESELHYLVGDSAQEIECLWKTLEVYNEHEDFPDYIDYSPYTYFESLFGNLSWRLSESDKYEDLLLATFCAQVSSRFSLHQTDSWWDLSENTIHEQNRLRSRILHFQRRLWTHPSPTLTFQPAVENRITLLQHTIDLHCTRGMNKELFGMTAALIDYDAWKSAQDKYLVRGWVEWPFQNEAELPRGVSSTVRRTPHPIYPQYGRRRPRRNPLAPLEPTDFNRSLASSTFTYDDDNSSVQS